MQIMMNAGELFACIARLLYTGQYEIGSPMPEKNYQDCKDLIDYVCNELERLDFTLSLISAREVRNVIHNEPAKVQGEHYPVIIFSVTSIKNYRGAFEALFYRFRDELSSKKVFILPVSHEKFYNPTSPVWGKEVEDKFLDMIEDITEANNCYALNRNTACVFHLMRVMEKAVQRLANKLCLPIGAVCDKEWQLIINVIGEKLKSLCSKHSDPDRVKYESILGHLETVKIAWRNPTMHPKATYTEEEAKTILSAVEAFVKNLAKTF